MWCLDLLVAVQVMFEKPCLPKAVRFEHAPSATSQFAQIGPDQVLTFNSKHIFRLGQATVVQRFLKITFLGHGSDTSTGKTQVLTYGSGMLSWRLGPAVH
jgi:hypothetical protein